MTKEHQESLDDMIKRNSSNDVEKRKESKEEHTLEDIPTATENQPIMQESEVGTVSITNLSDWFKQYVKMLDEISGVKGVRADIKNVDLNKNLIVTVMNETGDERDVWCFRRANELPVLNIAPNKMRVFENNTFEIDHNYNDLFIKTYNLKNKLVIVPCHTCSNLLVPYNKFKVKANETSVSIPGFSKGNIEQLLNVQPNMDPVEMRYRQIKKVKNNFKTNYDVIAYLNNRQSEVYDMNHIIQLDEVISGIVNGT